MYDRKMLTYPTLAIIGISEPAPIQGQKLRDLMIKNNNQFNLVEVELKRTAETKIEQNRAGQWVTKLFLMNHEGYTRTLGSINRASLDVSRKMADNSFLWAANHGLTRKNEVHGEEEAKLVLTDSFNWSKTEAERTEERTAMQVEAPGHTIQIG